MGRLGFFSIASFLLMVPLLYLANIYSQESLYALERASASSTSFKTSHYAEDVIENFNGILNISITTDGGNITIEDSIPAKSDIIQDFKLLSKFLDLYYNKDSDIEIEVFDNKGLPVDYDNLDSGFIFPPHNFEYNYPDFGKREAALITTDENQTKIENIHIAITNLNAQPILTAWAQYSTCRPQADSCANITIEIENETAIFFFDEFEIEPQQSSLRVDLDNGNFFTIDIGGGGTTNDIVKLVLNGDVSFDVYLNMETEEPPGPRTVEGVLEVRAHSNAWNITSEKWISE